MADPAFLAGLCFGLIVGALALMIYIKTTRRRPLRGEILDWEERSYAPPVVTKIQTANRRRTIDL